MRPSYDANMRRCVQLRPVKAADYEASTSAATSAAESETEGVARGQIRDAMNEFTGAL